MVETALMLTFVLLLMMAIIEFGFLIWASIQVTNAAREGARAGTLWDDTASLDCLETVSRAVGGNGEEGGELPASWTVGIDASANCDDDNLTAGEELSVAVSYDFSLPLVSNLPVIRDILGPSFTIRRVLIMRVQ